MINKIKLDLHKHRQYLGEILLDLEYWKFDYEVNIVHGTIVIEIYGASDGVSALHICKTDD